MQMYAISIVANRQPVLHWGGVNKGDQAKPSGVYFHSSQSWVRGPPGGTQLNGGY